MGAGHFEHCRVFIGVALNVNNRMNTADQSHSQLA